MSGQEVIAILTAVNVLLLAPVYWGLNMLFHKIEDVWRTVNRQNADIAHLQGLNGINHKERKL